MNVPQGRVISRGGRTALASRVTEAECALASVMRVPRQDGADESLISSDLEAGGSSFSKGLPPEWLVSPCASLAQGVLVGALCRCVPRHPDNASSRTVQSCGCLACRHSPMSVLTPSSSTASRRIDNLDEMKELMRDTTARSEWHPRRLHAAASCALRKSLAQCSAFVL